MRSQSLLSREPQQVGIPNEDFRAHSTLLDSDEQTTKPQGYVSHHQALRKPRTCFASCQVARKTANKSLNAMVLVFSTARSALNSSMAAVFAGPSVRHAALSVSTR